MTDKTDALLAPKLRNIISGYRINEDDARWLMGLLHDTLAEQPAEGGQGEAVCWGYRYKDRAAGLTHYNTFRHPISEMGFTEDRIDWWVIGVKPNTAPPAASVDVEGLRELAKYIVTVLGPNVPKSVTDQGAAWEWASALESAIRLVELIDSAGGAKENNNGA
jgi:hypothetical protein